MAYDILLRAPSPRDFSRGGAIAPQAPPAACRPWLLPISILGIGLEASAIAARPKIQGLVERRHYLREFDDDPRSTLRLPSIPDAPMKHPKSRTSNKRQQEQRQSKRELEEERQRYRDMYARDRAITQEIPVIPMYNLIQGNR
jgi:hypothetical protein